MTVASAPGTRRSIAVRGIQTHGWDIRLAAAGAASAEVLGGQPIRVALTEGDGAGRPDRSGPAMPARTRLTLAPDGALRVRCDAAPPVLLVPACAEPVHTLLGGCDRVAVTVEPGGVLFACTPSVLDALEPAELLAAPRLLRRCPDPATLLRRWLETVERRGGPGASAAIARRQATLGALRTRQTADPMEGCSLSG